jgi:hypothetical protein
MAKVITTVKSGGKTEVKVEGITSDELTDEACQLGQAEHNNIDLNQGNQ